MEETQNSAPQQESDSINSTQPTNSNGISPKGMLIFILAVVILGSSGAFVLQKNVDTQSTITKQQEETAKANPILKSPIAPYTFVYGAWTGGGSLVKSLDLTTGENKTLALLPINIKKISVVSQDTLLYIDQTDDRDHGKQLSLYSLETGKGSAAIKAQEGYGIDEYVISPNKKYISTWEVSIPQGATALKDGRSRVYTASLDNPQKKNLLYDEPANAPVHYPRAILDDGRVLLDTFLANDPNGGTGWAYGMSVANFDGSNKQALSQMTNGTYGTQPFLSPNGNTLVFAGYDGSNGPGTAIKNGFRQAILTPNTVETLDVNTLKREKIAELPNTNLYTSAKWDKTTENLILSVISKNGTGTGMYLFDVKSKISKKIELTSDGTEDLPTIVTPVSSDKFIVGITEDSSSTIGNLGDSYSSAYKQFTAQSGNNAPEAIALPDQYMQYITLLPSDYFHDIKAMNVQLSPTQTIVTTENSSGKTENLQLYTFFLKADLGPSRETQQTSTVTTPTASGQRCRDLAAQQCGYQNASEDEKRLKLATDSCARQVKAQAKQHGECYDSPLYLYGPKGTNVSVKVHTPVHSSTPGYNDGYNATLLGNGTFTIGNKVYSEIDYAYTSALKKVLPPSYGAFVAKDEVENVLRQYAQGLGLNEKETADLVAVGKKRVTSPYAFVSFFDHKKSQMILPLSFIPQPDNYLNVVFYFKLLNEKPAFSVAAPTFGEPLKRSGFTAVEVSEIVE